MKELKVGEKQPLLLKLLKKMVVKAVSLKVIVMHVYLILSVCQTFGQMVRR